MKSIATGSKIRDEIMLSLSPANAITATAEVPSVTDMCAHERKVRSLEKTTLGSILTGILRSLLGAARASI